MSVPKKRRTKGSKGRRASHFALSKITLVACPNCKKPIRPHYACDNCGKYKEVSLAQAPATVKKEVADKTAKSGPKKVKTENKK